MVAVQNLKGEIIQLILSRKGGGGGMYSTLQVYQRSNAQVRHIPPKMSDKFESQHSLSPTIWSDILVLVGRESGY